MAAVLSEVLLAIYKTRPGFKLLQSLLLIALSDLNCLLRTYTYKIAATLSVSVATMVNCNVFKFIDDELNEVPETVRIKRHKVSCLKACILSCLINYPALSM